jgi:hypothetical protein
MGIMAVLFLTSALVERPCASFSKLAIVLVVVEPPWTTAAAAAKHFKKRRRVGKMCIQILRGKIYPR